MIARDDMIHDIMNKRVNFMEKIEFMSEAIKEAYDGINKKHGGPFGTVIVKDNKIIGRGHNQVLLNHDLE